MSKSQKQTSSTDDGVLADIATTVGSALGSVVAKVSETPKVARSKGRTIKAKAAKRSKTAGKKKLRLKRRK